MILYYYFPLLSYDINLFPYLMSPQESIQESHSRVTSSRSSFRSSSYWIWTYRNLKEMFLGRILMILRW